MLDYTSKEIVNIGYSDLDCNLILKPYSLLNYLQNVAVKDADRSGLGFSKMSGYSWFLIKYRMEFNNYPININTLTIGTKSLGYNKIFAYRGFTILNNSRLLGRVISLWSIIDFASRKTVNIADLYINNPSMPIYVKTENDLIFSKVNRLIAYEFSKEFEVLYNDLDNNGHANNGNYIVWALEVLPIEFKCKYKIKNLDIIFKKEARYGEKIISEASFKSDLVTNHQLKNSQGEVLCRLECEWEEIKS